jgi:cold-inducible RNA-binding protein
MSVRLFVGNLPYDATEEDIRAHFATAGNLASVFLPVDRETGRKRGFGFVEFIDAAAAQEAIRLFNNQPFKGRALAVNEARAKEPGSRPAPPSGGGYRSGPSAGGRPSAPMMGRPSGQSMHRSPPPDFMTDPAAERGRGDRTRKFGPDAKPARIRAQRFKGPDGGKRAFKEKLGGQIFGDVNDEEDVGQEPEIDNFAMGVDDAEGGQ